MIVYIISNTAKSVAFEIIADGFKNEKVHYILIQKESNTEFTSYLTHKKISFQVILARSRFSLIPAFIKVIFILLKLRPCIVHTQLREANYIGLTAAWLCNVKNRIYTRHHSTFNIEYFPKEVKWDKYINTVSTKIISTSKNVSNVLLKSENVKADKIVEIPHGFYLNKYQLNDQEKVERLKLKYNLEQSKYPIIGVVARYLKLKGVNYIIEGFVEFKKLYPHAHLVLANAGGGDQVEIKTQLSQTLSERDYTEIPFENDVFGLFNLFDYFVHVPVNKDIEAFGQIYVEALAAAVPSVFTLSGIANEFIIDEFNALVVDYKSSRSITEALIRLSKDSTLRTKLQKNGLESIYRFSHKTYIESHFKLYDKLCRLKDKQ